MAISALESQEIRPVGSNSSRKESGNAGSMKALKGEAAVAGGSDRTDSALRRPRPRPVPTLRNDKLQLMSRLTQKRVIQANVSSFPEAINIYKANSDEFKTPKRTKKTKKSVYTLPNAAPTAPHPQGTVSDMNESEYNVDEDLKLKLKKKVHSRKNRRRHTFEIFDPDAQRSYELDCSSSEMIKHYGGDGKPAKKSDTKEGKEKNKEVMDMWTVLKNINKFQFKSTPRSLSPAKKSTGFSKKQTNLPDGRRLIETYRTSEVSYVANFEFESTNRPIVTPSISGDRITVIENTPRKNLKASLMLTKPTTPRILQQKCENTKINPSNFKASAIREFNKYAPAEKCIPVVKLPTANNARSMKVESKSKLSVDSSNDLRTNDTSMEMDERDFVTIRCKPDVNQAIQDKNAKDFDRMKDRNGNKKANTGMERIGRPREVVTLPAGAMLPTLSTADIKRKLKQITLPFAVLGKDKISSRIEVSEYTPPQFNGLDNHIWPFMEEWSKKKKEADRRKRDFDHNNGNIRKFNDFNKKVIVIEPKRKSERKPQPDTNTTFGHSKYMQNFKDKMLKLIYRKGLSSEEDETRDWVTPVSEGVITVDAATEPMRENRPRTPSAETRRKSSGKKNTSAKGSPRKQSANLSVEKAMRNKEQVARKAEGKRKVAPKKQVIYPQGIPKSLDEVLHSSNKVTPKKLTELLDSIEIVRPKSANKDIINSIDSQSQLCVDRALSKQGKGTTGKWIFVDNILKKIRNGVYYSDTKKVNFIDNNKDDGLLDFDDPKDADNESCMQKAIVPKNFHPEAIIEGQESFAMQNDACDIKIPGFDDVRMHELEINTLSCDKITVKHRRTNVIIQFDISVPSRPCDRTVGVNKSSSFIPLAITESNTKVFKFNKKIINAMLPAELCSLLPRMMRDFIDSEAHLALFPVSTPVTQVQTISNVFPPRTSNTNSFNVFSLIPKYLSVFGSPALIKILDGSFSYGKLFHPCVCCSSLLCVAPIQPTVVLPYCDDEADMLPTYSIPIPFCLCIVNPRDFVLPQAGIEEPKQIPNNQVVPFDKSKDLTELDEFSFPRIIQTMRNFYSFNLTVHVAPCIAPFKLKCDMVLSEIEDFEKTLQVSVRNQVSYNFFELKATDLSNLTYAKEDLKVTDLYPVKATVVDAPDVIVPAKRCNIPKLTLSVRLGRREVKIRSARSLQTHKKCKSASNLSAERACTPLTKINNLDDFLQALGNLKSLASVFGGYAGNKIISSVTEMKRWVADITPRQAMLVVLLTNKKATPRLQRLQPVILQGIAVNRITTATELDMEIEVIETENVGVTREYEGISYVPASIANRNSLLEEMSWIAKTTASDYNKPFDNSSEKLLKNLLEKRKKLNPSYLRVVARYVGLGLLKTPKP